MAEVRDLSVCIGCQCDTVIPVEWCEAPGGMWWVELRCGNCGLGEANAFDQATVDAFDTKLDSQIAKMAEALANLEVAHFVEALDADAILPEDF